MNITEELQTTPAEAKTTPRYSLKDSVFAWLSLLAGYGFCRLFPASHHPLGSVLLILTLFLGTIGFLAGSGTRIRGSAAIAAVCGVFLSFSAILNSNLTIRNVAVLSALIAYIYSVSAATGNVLQPGFSDLIFQDFFRALFLLPFASFFELFRALKKTNGNARKESGFLKILIGLLLTAMPTALILMLLSFDSGFLSLLRQIFRIDLFSHLISLIFGIPAAMYLFGLYISSREQKCKTVITAEKCRYAASELRFAPVSTAIAASAPILFLYVIFFLSQWKYYVSGFLGVLPDEQSYAEYARNGFFQLCIVSVINFILIGIFNLIVRRKNGGSVPLKILTAMFSGCTLLLISTAMAKLWLYIRRYGLTPKRIYAAWFMGVLAVLFLLLLLKQVFEKFRFLPTALTVSVLMFALLAFSGSDRWIAAGNVDRYLDGTLAELDVTALVGLGDAAIPELVRAGEALCERNGTSLEAVYNADPKRGSRDQTLDQICTALRNFEYREPETFFSFNVPYARAKAAMEAAGLLTDN